MNAMHEYTSYLNKNRSKCLFFKQEDLQCFLKNPLKYFRKSFMLILDTAGAI